ncbi:hypothetical protein ACFP1Z_09265 [Streptomyces gamaensis]|uniref:Uncharacterized protein n=1 Tax=Streptomyces gamaensis TaxID=1763542 RepID=A0ABW0YYP0_9ACTN
MQSNPIRHRPPRAAEAVRTVRIARELRVLSPEAATVLLTPVRTDRDGFPCAATVVALLDEVGHPVGITAASARIVRDVLRRDFSRANWSRPHRYEVRTGHLVQRGAPQLPPALGGNR